MQEKDTLQQEQNLDAQQTIKKVEGVQQDVAVDDGQQLDLFTQIDGEVASFGVEPSTEVVVAPPIELPNGEISKEIKQVDEQEQKDIQTAQQKAQQQYMATFGDRQIRKPSKTIALVISIVAILLVGAFVVTKIPMFYNCMVPGNKTVIENLYDSIGNNDIKEADNGERVWGEWYDYNKNTQQLDFKYLPGATVSTPEEDRWPTDKIFANLDADTMGKATDYAQTNLLVGTRATASALNDDIKYVTVIYYQFDDVDESKKFAEAQKAKYSDGQYEHKNAVFFQLGMVKGTGNGYVYDAWYNGGNYIEVYATDKDLAEEIRTQINYLS